MKAESLSSDNVVTLCSKAHNNRTLEGITVSSASECLIAMEAGHSIQSIEFVLRRPEYMLCDIANPKTPISLLSTLEIFEYYELCKKFTLKNHRKNLISGIGLDTEIAIFGDSVKELHSVGKKIDTEILSQFSISDRTQQYSLFDGRGLQKTRSLNTLRPNVIDEYLDLTEEIKEYYVPEFVKYVNIFSLSTVYQNHQVWLKLKELGENFVFVLNSGIRFYLSMRNSVGSMPAVFVEIHRQNDAYELFRKNDIMKLERNSICAKGRFVILDIAYTGGTINQAENLIKQHYGNNVEIVKVSLFPKSFEAIKCSDYCVFAGRLINLSTALLTKENWAKQLLHIGGENE